MSIQAILLPLFVEVTLTLLLLLWLAVLRRNDFTSGAVQPSQIALREPNWPKRTAQAANSYSNQFELPVLFYVLTILEWVTRHAGVLFVLLAFQSFQTLLDDMLDSRARCLQHLSQDRRSY